MKPDRQWIACPVPAAAAITALLLLAAPVAHAATTEYQYDALARLRRVVHDNGVATSYALDAAGNRTQVDDLQPAMPLAPSSLEVPASSDTGMYVVRWAASTGGVLRYELAESTSSSFVPQAVLPSGDASVTVRDRPTGTYYYRVRACGTPGCSAYTVGGNPVVVTLAAPPPAAPQNLRASFVANCVWRATWDAVPGAAYYRLRESVGVERTVVAPQADVVCQGGNQNSNKPDRVRACNAAAACGTSASF
jgi:YD repeat-containing protein